MSLYRSHSRELKVKNVIGEICIAKIDSFSIWFHNSYYCVQKLQSEGIAKIDSFCNCILLTKYWFSQPKGMEADRWIEGRPKYIQTWWFLERSQLKPIISSKEFKNLSVPQLYCNILWTNHLKLGDCTL